MIRLEKISIRQGSFLLTDLDLEVPAGTHTCLMGASGCGKTTLMEILCGLRKPDQGRILLGGLDHTNSPPSKRGIGYLPQDSVLFPNLSVSGHLALPLKARHWKGNQIEERVLEVAHFVGIHHLLSRHPQGLSGGEKQRVALGRALSFHPRILCLDEPFSALDEGTRNHLMNQLKALKQSEGITILHILHQPEEAFALADHTLVLTDGTLTST